MGDFKEHILFGLLFAAVLSYFLKEVIDLTVFETFLGALAVFLGSIIPDIDHKKSYVHRAVKAFVSIFAAMIAGVLTPLELSQRYLVAVTVFLLVYTGISQLKIKHRGFTHTLTFCIILTSAAITASVTMVYTAIPGIALGVGILSHLILDREFRF